MFYFLIALLIGSLAAWGLFFYFSKTTAVATYGGEYIEGIVGQPQHLNPVIAVSNNADDDITQIIYSGLLKYNAEAKLQSDLAESYEISEDKMLYTFHLRQDVLWHDGQPLTAEDILFTVNLITDPAYKSPLRGNWQGIETTMVDNHTITFGVKNPYAGLLNNFTFGVLPKHIWETISPDQFPLADVNLEPIGSGPYKYASYQKDSSGNIISYKLAANPGYYAGKPYISKMTFNFYPDDNSILEAYNKKEIMGISGLSPQKTTQIKLQQSTALHKFNIPRYFAVFLNQTKSIPLANDEVRFALSYATNREEIINKVLNGNGTPIYSPILPGMIGYSDEIEKRQFDLEKANKLLDDNGWSRGEDGVRSKNGVALEIDLATTEWDELQQTAEMIKEQWGKIGARVNLNILSISDIQQNYIRPREYEALLFGQVLGADPDPYSFWHSTQKKDPGLNLSLFGDNKADGLIESGRAEFDREKRAAIYQEFQQIIAKEAPAVFLYSPDYIYPVNKKVQGINTRTLVSPAKRFSDINLWHIKTKRIWK
ncbi:MAG TPA: ABC transporter substrate-binding protein [Patescibacteria group bacterium]